MWFFASPTMNKEFNSDIFSIKLIEHNITEVTIHAHQIFDVEQAKLAKDINQEYTNGKPYGYIGIKNEFSTITKEAKALMAGDNIAKHSSLSFNYSKPI